ncbi:hypothetical protein GCM10023187_22860 [Nibrella viscosa]|uniref:Uncharacterized protein n=1 Tax=Nibrella viscosa TaxID=1084524 RepID=A0ABP8KFJ1_9BACT
MNPEETNEENQEAYERSNTPEETAPDSETQSSAASAQGNRNNLEQRLENTGGTTGPDEDKAEGRDDI